MYVIDLQPKTNTVVLGSEKDLLQSEVICEDMYWSEPPIESIKVQAKIRYNMIAVPATLHPSGKLVFDEPVKAVTPGQMMVAYRGATVVAGGLIADENRTTRMDSLIPELVTA
jgi:tRNA-specific 2-thiouridylase